MNFNLYTVSKNGFFSRSYNILENDYVIYTVKRSFFFKSCVLYTDQGAEVFTIRKRPAFFKSKFSIEYQGQPYASVESTGKLKTGLQSTIDNDLYEVKGTLLSTEFTISKNSVEIAKISRKKFTLRNKIGIAIHEDEDDEIILALVFIIEMLVHSKKSKSG